MRAMLLEKPKEPLKLAQIPIPIPKDEQILVRVEACGVCRTDLHIADGELPSPHLPLVLGHQIVGYVEEKGKKAYRFNKSDRVGIPWLGYACGACRFCVKEEENLCENALFTGYQLNGGFAEYCVANEAFCFPIPAGYEDVEVAPLLCGGLIGFRAYRLAGAAKRLGFYGFGSSAHILLQVASHQEKEVWAFTRTGDHEAQKLARQLGAVWAGSSDEKPDPLLEAAILFAPVGSLVPRALEGVDKGGQVICAGIYMSDIPSFPYAILYGEKQLRSVTNLTRQDGNEFFAIAREIKIQTQVTVYSLEQANQALADLRQGRFAGSAVIKIRD